MDPDSSKRQIVRLTFVALEHQLWELDVGQKLNNSALFGERDIQTVSEATKMLNGCAMLAIRPKTSDSSDSSGRFIGLATCGESAARYPLDAVAHRL
jgi:hypothetical protein